MVRKSLSLPVCRARKRPTDAISFGFVKQVVGHVGAHARPGEDADPARERLRRVAGVLQRLPGHLEEVAVLRVHDRGLARAEAEEARVEELQVLEGGAALDVGGVGQEGRVHPAGAELLVAQAADRLLALVKVVPEFGYVARAGHAEGPADDRDVGRGHLGHGGIGGLEGLARPWSG